jgi:hypothetical protein
MRADSSSQSQHSTTVTALTIDDARGVQRRRNLRKTAKFSDLAALTQIVTLHA